MKELSLEEIRECQIKMLSSIDAFCLKNNLNYYLAYGSCIGAIRHEGFIPWDDDIDICMPREDYDFFLKNYKNTVFNIMNYENKNYFFPFSKLIDSRTILKEQNLNTIDDMGVFVDIFPIDGLGNDLNKAKKMIYSCSKKFLTVYGVRNYCAIKWSIKTILFFIHRINYFFFSKSFLKSIENQGKSHPYKTSKYCGVIFGFYGDRELLETAWFDGYVLRKFEGYEFRVPIGWDYYLKSVYGNYMQLPPIEKQKTHHSFVAYWK